MRLTVLADNNTLTDHYFLGEPGLSILVEHEGQQTLLDAGYSDVFLQNAVKMGLDLLQLDRVVLSHGHLDHTWGLTALIRLRTEAAIERRNVVETELLAHPLALQSKSRDYLPEIGSLLSADQLGRHFRLNLREQPMQLGEGLYYLGEIPRRFAFERMDQRGRRRWGPDGPQPDALVDDTALAFRCARGLVLITGCSHSGICNIAAQAMDVTGVSRIVDIIGGLHLLKASKERLEKTVDYLTGVGLEALHACHCTDLEAKIALAGGLPVRETGSGLVLEYPDAVMA
ncbi:MAG TPA: MBL fold metallo-hydrolase [Desulfonatronum sp.]|nr:MBL fold metallo-hydrolase [Desulfonatronum sp.]